MKQVTGEDASPKLKAMNTTTDLTISSRVESTTTLTGSALWHSRLGHAHSRK